MRFTTIAAVVIATFVGFAQAEDVAEDRCVKKPCPGFDQYEQDPDTCECTCAIQCGRIYVLDEEACTCIPIPG